MWIKQLVELLIAKYKQNEHLYNVRHPKYLDRTYRSSTLLKICEELQEFCEDVTVDEIKKKIHTLRAQYIRVFREISKRGADSEDVEPKLWCFKQLEFLRPYCTMRKPFLSEINEFKNGVTDGEDTSELNTDSKYESPSNEIDICSSRNFDIFEEVECDNYFSTENPSKRPKKENFKYEKYTNSTIIDKGNEFSAFATSISYQLEKLPEADAYMLMAEIQNLITQRKLKNLRETNANESI